MQETAASFPPRVHRLCSADRNRTSRLAYSLPRRGRRQTAPPLMMHDGRRQRGFAGVNAVRYRVRVGAP